MQFIGGGNSKQSIEQDALFSVVDGMKMILFEGGGADASLRYKAKRYRESPTEVKSNFAEQSSVIQVTRLTHRPPPAH